VQMAFEAILGSILKNAHIKGKFNYMIGFKMIQFILFVSLNCVVINH
jgi:hypothetical protein